MTTLGEKFTPATYALDRGDVVTWCADYADKVRAGQAEPFHGAFGDPPYLLEFMGSGDRDAPHRRYARDNPTHIAMLADLLHLRAWEAAAVLWYREVFSTMRACLLPGAPVLMCAGPRTDDLMAMGMRAAGLDVRDKLMYVYGSGMPHGRDISKALDEEAGAERAVIGYENTASRYDGANRAPTVKYSDRVYRGQEGDSTVVPITAPATAEAEQWSGYNTALKPAYETLIYAINPFQGTYADAALRWGTAGIDVDSSRLAIDPERDDARLGGKGAFKTDKMAKTAYEGEYAGKEIASSPLGRYPTNLLLQHDEACELLGTRYIKSESGDVAESPDLPRRHAYGDRKRTAFAGHADEDGMELVEDWACAEGCPVAELDRQSGVTKSVRSQRGGANIGSFGGTTYLGGGIKKDTGIERGFNDRGGASRFFYTSKVAAWEREAGLDGMPIHLQQRTNAGGLENEPRWAPKPTRNPHPTLKSIRALVYLLRAIGRPAHVQGRLLVPFAGTGSEMIAAMLSGGWSHIQGIELDSDERYPGAFVPIALARLSWWAQFRRYEDARRAVLGERVFARALAEAEETGQLALFT